jgi:hypothetical protein
MNENNDVLWLQFQALAKMYPDDGGVRMTADLARWLLEQHQRAQLPAPPIVEKVLRSVTQELDAGAPVKPPPVTGR